MTEEVPPENDDSQQPEARLAALQSSEMKLPPVVRRLEAGTKLPVCVIVVGMAGSGKTTLLSQLQRHVDDQHDQAKQQQKEEARQSQADSTTSASQEEEEDDDDEDESMPAYCVNLDPATLGETPYDVSIDIRDTVNYKQVMEQHQLGPNGAIMTSLNLFATKFDQVLGILERRAVPSEQPNATATTQEEQEEDIMDYILVDTPGQIEAFTWSASGQIISEALASSFPTVLCFVVDTVRCASSPNTFMSNMLYACSMLYRTRLPLVVCFNKIDVVSHEFCLDWMRDYESFQQALDDHASDSGFYGSLTRSLSLVLDEFYSNFANAVGVSAVTGDGMTEFWDTVQKAAAHDFPEYVADLKLRVQEQDAKQRAVARGQVRRLQQDLAAEQESKGGK
eukprot:CAMPEP_0172443866 /NCGR_PEP_ID=MMETSP1065-20121228/4049_1 /TAXON_ID=265537 /ORGANISM="Amphiprora paludosa, Strain CCMP125" /LENGTH=393 /DNA_ID=CAMNT_0013194243 /DNA_START=35 /DNA_END=1219 /DNA_ORIENTATION=+